MSGEPKSVDATIRAGNASAGNDAIYVLRTAQQHTVMLGQMADQKANIIIGVSLIYFSVIGSRLVGGSLTDQRFLLPLAALSLTIFAAFFLAVTVVVPRAKTHPCRDPQDMPNPLFFGSFTSCPEDRFVAHMLDRLADGQAAREMLLRDIHQIGVVLRRKYRLLRYAYTLLAAGVLISGLLLVGQLLLVPA